MAEFIDVMRNAKRICDEYADKHKCNGCPIDTFEGCVFAGGVNCDEVYFAQMERIVCDWAKKHPEPMYPSWREGWRQLFPEAITSICPLMCATGSVMDEYQLKCYGSNCYECKGTQMNAEVAEKLGIKPIGGK